MHLGLAPNPASDVRKSIHYWKCDRPAAFHGTSGGKCAEAGVEPGLRQIMQQTFGNDIVLKPGGGTGNHRIFLMSAEGAEFFVRVEDGPEGDQNMEVESAILGFLRNAGIPAPAVYAVDASRACVPFAFQVLELIPCSDLNRLNKEGELDLKATAERIGEAVGIWQSLPVSGFGPFSPDSLRKTGELEGFHEAYADYFTMHLERHLQFLADRGFLVQTDQIEILRTISAHRELMELESGCLVHKDLALWNILGTPDKILAFIDWDDAIAGDPMDDISLLGCFFDGHVIEHAIAGYQKVRMLPENHTARFWLHLLRNMLVKAVIRVGAGYFDRGEDLFLFERGMSGAEFQAFTKNRIRRAVEGLRSRAHIRDL